MPALNFNEDLNPQDNIANEISLTLYEIILADYDIFCLAASVKWEFDNSQYPLALFAV